LGQVKYGPHVSAAFLTDETTPQPWDDVYSFATPKKSFDILIHCSNLVHAQNKRRKPGSSFMTFSPAGRVKALLDKSEEVIIDIYLQKLHYIFLHFSNYVSISENAIQIPKLYINDLFFSYIYLKDLDSIFPDFSKYVVEAHVEKFPYGSA